MARIGKNFMNFIDKHFVALVLTAAGIVVAALIIRVAYDWSTIDYTTPNPMTELKMDEKNINDGDKIASQSNTIHTCEKGCRCDGSGRWLDVNGEPSEVLYCIPTDAERANYLQQRLVTADQRIVELEWDRLELLGSLEKTTIDLKYIEEANKKLIQIKRQVFSAGDKIVTRLDCRPSTSTPDAAHNVTTYEISCDLP